MILEQLVNHITHTGQGIVSISDKTYFIPGTIPGDIIQFEVENPSKYFKFEQGKLLKIITPSKDRVIPKCKYQGHSDEKCGGCPLMIASYEAQLSYKENRIKYLVNKSQLKNVKINSIIPSPNQLSYRNRCQLKTDGKKIGFMSNKSNKTIDIKNCIVLTDKLQQTLSKLNNQLPNEKWMPNYPYKWNTIHLDDQTDNISLNKRPIFRQGNDKQNSAMCQWVDNQLKHLNQTNIVMELFCGSGNLTKIISANNFSRIVAIDATGKATDILKSKTLKNVNIKCMDIYKKNFLNKISKEASNTTLLIIDPPRDGLRIRKNFFKTFSKLKQCIYISCNPETFIKDTRFFNKNGLSLKEITPLDMFPQTTHSELMAIFQR